MTFWKKQNCSDGEQIWGCYGFRTEGGFDYKGTTRGIPWGVEIALHPTCDGGCKNLGMCKNSQRNVHFIVYTLKH